MEPLLSCGIGFVRQRAALLDSEEAYGNFPDGEGRVNTQFCPYQILAGFTAGEVHPSGFVGIQYGLIPI
jgi:hypothetical protein